MEKIMLLFDIDGTLIYSGGAGIRSIEKSFIKLYGLKNAMENISPDGKTDPLIIEEVFLDKLNRKPSLDEVKRVLAVYLENLKVEIYNEKYKVFEGVIDFLEWAQKTEKFILGLATGNLEEGAKIKLKPSGLLRYFEFGGYASDSPERSEILKRAYERGNQIAIRGKFKIKEVFVIGDTPRDILAAKRAGFLSIGMALFNHSKKELLKAGANYAFESYKELKKFLSQYISSSEG
ncbi:MAG: HAD hydrolase-like protein [Candidatus Hydrothermales bacterium]